MPQQKPCASSAAPARGSRDRGASAVEFALLVPVLVLLLLGILQYGVWFTDSIGLRHGAREAVRSAAVTEFSPCTGPGSDAAAKTACLAKERSGVLAKDVYARVLVRSSSWTEGGRLTVCLMADEQGFGFGPLPGDGVLRTKATSRIEVDNVPATVSSYTADAPTRDWSWCTA